LDLNGVVCGMMCAMTLTPNVPLYVAAITAFFAVIFMKGAFGGHGKNLLHSAFGARVLASLCFHDAFIYDTERKYTLFDHLIGNTEGALGEVSVIILAAVCIYLIARRVISAITPAAVLSTFALVTFLTAPQGNAPDTVKLTLFGSAIIFVSVFCGTEYSTVPKSAFGKLAYGSLCGAVAAVIVRYTSYEGAYIAALIASAAITPLFARLYEVEPFGDDAADEEASPLPSYFKEDDETAEDEEEDETDEEYTDTLQDEGSDGEDAGIDDKTSVFEKPVEEKEEPDMSIDGLDEVMQKIIAENLEAENAGESTVSEQDNGDSEEFSDSMEFSIEKADEILEHLSKEIGLMSEGETLSEPEPDTEDDTKKGTTADDDMPIDSTAVFNKLLEEVESENNKK